MVVDAMQAVKTTNNKNEVQVPREGGQHPQGPRKRALESMLVKGYALELHRRLAGHDDRGYRMPRLPCLDMNLQKERMKLGVQITVDDPQQLEQIRAAGVRHGY